MERYKEIERSIITTYRKYIWSKFVKAISTYELIKENDKIMVCISGGKDSFLLAKCIEELKRHGKVPFQACYVVMNPGYNIENRKSIMENARILNVDLEVFESDIFAIADTFGNKNTACYMCARMRRGHLYNKARELGCNKIALGHHFDDVIETTLLSMMYGCEIKTMMPKLHSENYKGLELIRPLYLVKEKDILLWKNSNKLEFLNCACRFTQKLAIDDVDSSKRKEMKNLINELRKTNPNVDFNIFKSMSNINLDAILGYREDGIVHSFLEDYNNKKSDV